VVSVDPAAKSIVMKSGARTVTVQAGDKTIVRRYSPDSARPADATAATLADVKPGDQAHVLGNRSEDGATVAAEQIYAGTFRQLAATIDSIDPASGELKVTDLATKKKLSIRIMADTTMKKLPEETAQMLARRYQVVQRGEADRASAPGAGRGAGRGGDIGAILDRLPAIHAADLKAK